MKVEMIQPLNLVPLKKHLRSLFSQRCLSLTLKANCHFTVKTIFMHEKGRKVERWTVRGHWMGTLYLAYCI